MFEILLFFYFQATFSLISYVSPHKDCEHHCTGTFDSPFPSIQTALDSMNSKFSSTLCLLDGIYTGSSNTNLQLQNEDLEITSLNGPDKTIIDCQNDSFGIIFISKSFIISNITIRNCVQNNSNGDPSKENSGGALLILNGELRIINVRIENCQAKYGGAIACLNGICHIESSRLLENMAISKGGAIYSLNSTFFINSSNVIQNNKVNLMGAGIFSEKSQMMISGINSVINNNKVSNKNISSDIYCSLNSEILINNSINNDFEAQCDDCIILKNCNENDNESSCVPECLCHQQFFSQGKCLCKQGFVMQQNNSFCEPCYNNCYNCSGVLENECLSCKSGFVLRNGSCLENCMINEYISQQNECLPCDSSCLTCFNWDNSSCLSCKSEYILQNSSCISNIIQNVNDNMSDNNTTINEIITNNSDNNTGNSSEKNQSILIKLIKCDIIQNNSESYLIVFSDYWPKFFENLESFTFIKVNDTSVHFNYSIAKNESLQNSFNLNIKINNFSSNVSCFCINISFDINERSQENAYFLLNDTFVLVIQNNFDSFLKITEKIFFKLYYTKTINSILLKFNKYEEKLDINSSVISIEGLKNNQDFNYFIKKLSNLEYSIDFIFVNPFFEKKTLRVTIPSLNFSDSLLLNSHYNISEEELARINAFLLVVDYIGPAFTIKFLVFLNVLLNKGSSKNSLSSLILMELISNIKFIDLNYPSNLMVFFYEKSHDSFNFFWKCYYKFDLEAAINIPPLFLFYGVRPFFLDNAGDLIFQIFFVYFSALFILVCLWISEFCIKFNNKFMNFIGKTLNMVKFIKNAFVWELVLFILFAKFPEILFFSVLSMRFGYYYNFNGLFNFSCAILCCVVLFCFLVHFFIVNLKIYSYSIEKNAKTDENKHKISKQNSIKDISVANDIEELPQEKCLCKIQTFKSKLDLENKHSTISIKNNEEIVNNQKFIKIRSENIISIQDFLSIQSERRPIKNENELFSQQKLVSSIQFIESFPRKAHKNKKFSGFHRNSLKSSQNIQKNNLYETLSQRYCLLNKANNYKIPTFWQKYFVFLDLSRQTSYVLIIVLLFSHGTTQIYMISGIQIMFFVSILLIKPYNSKISTINLIISELCLTTAFICCLCIGIFDSLAVAEEENRKKIGNAIIFSNLCLTIWSFLYAVMKFLLKLGGLLKKSQEGKKLSKK